MDLPFSLTFYRWLLGHEQSLSLVDIHHVAPDLYKTLRNMQEIIRQRDDILIDENFSEDEKNTKVLVDYLYYLYFIYIKTLGYYVSIHLLIIGFSYR